MVLARKLDAQYQQYNKTIHEIFLEEIPLLLPKCEEPKRHKREIEAILLKQLFKLEYLEEAMTLYGTYNADCGEELLDTINHLHRKLTKYK